MESKSFLRKFISNPIIQALLIYVSGAWVVIELLEYFIEHLSISEQLRILVLIMLLCGLPMALFLAWYLNREKVSDRLNKTYLCHFR